MQRRFLVWGVLVALVLGGSAAVGTAVKAYVQPRRKPYSWTVPVPTPAAAVRNDLLEAGRVLYSTPRDPSPDESAEFQAVVGQLKDVPQQVWMLDQTFDGPRMGEELARLGWYRATQKPVTEVQLAADGNAFLNQLRQSVATKNWPFDYESVSVQKVAPNANGTEAVLSVAGRRAKGNGTSYFRVWVKKDPTNGWRQWRVFDFDDPETHIRYTCRYAATYGGGTGNQVPGTNPPGSSIFFGETEDPPVAALRAALTAAAGGDAAEVRRQLATVDLYKITPVLDAVRRVAAARLDILEGRFAEAEQSLERAETAWRDTPAVHPARAALALARNKPGEARTAVAAYRAMGLESAETVILAAADPAAAVDAEFRRGHELFPTDARLYAAWAKHSTAAAKESASALAARPDHDSLLPRVIDLCDPPLAASFTAEYCRARPQDPTGMIESAAVALKAGREAAAGQLVKKAFAASEGKPQKIVALYAVRSVAYGKALPAYRQLAEAGAAEAAFAALADHLRLNLNPANASALIAVAEARAAANGKDHTPYVAKADGHSALRDYSAAAAALAEAMKRLPGMDDPAWEPCRAKRCESLAKLGLWETALAELGPVPATYAQLATLLADAKDAAALEKLVTNHAAKNPQLDPKLLKAEVAHIRKDSAAVLALTADTLETGWLPDDEWANRAMRRRVRAHYRLDQLPKAEPLAHRIDGLMPAWVKLAQSLKAEDPAGAVAAMRGYIAVGGTPAQFYADEDLSPLAESPKLGQFRQQFPKPAATPKR